MKILLQPLILTLLRAQNGYILPLASQIIRKQLNLCAYIVYQCDFNDIYEPFFACLVQQEIVC